MKNRFFAFFFLVFLFSTIPFRLHNVTSLENYYEIDGETVFVDDENIYLAVYPHTSSGGWVYINFTSKKLEGEIDFALGFDSSKSKPSKLEYYNPHTVEHLRSYSVHEMFFSNTTYYKADYTFSSQDQSYFYYGELFLWSKISYDENLNEIILEDWSLIYNQSFDYANKQSKTIYWVEHEYREWKVLSKKNLDWKKINYVYADMNRWYTIKHNVVKNQTYHLRLWLNVIPNLDGETSKFWVAVKPSSETLGESIDKGHFYALDPWWDDSFIYSTRITIDSTKIDSDLTDFPVLVYLNSPRIDWSHVQNDLDDLRFIDSTNSTVFSHEIENYTVNSEAWLWVKISFVNSTSDTVFYMYYGNTMASSVEDAENVWDSNFVMVQHLVDITNSTVLDSTSYNNDGDKKAGDQPLGVSSGQIDGAQDFELDNSHYIKVDDSVSLDVLANITFEAWVKIENHTNSRTILRKGSEAGTDITYLWYYQHINKLSFFSSGAGTPEAILAWTPSDGVWYYLTFIVESDRTGLMYVDAIQLTSYTKDETFLWVDDADPLMIGEWSSFDWDGLQDEFRISDVIRSGAWINATYESGRDNLLSFGVEETFSVLEVDNLSIRDMIFIFCLFQLVLAVWGFLGKKPLLNILAMFIAIFIFIPLQDATVGTFIFDVQIISLFMTVVIALFSVILNWDSIL